MEKKKLLESFLVQAIIFSGVIFGFSYLSDPKPATLKQEDSPKVVFFDVGQGDATGLVGLNHYILVDGGPDKSILNELPKTMKPLSKRIDYVFLSHPHADHLAGINYLVERYEVGGFYGNGMSYSSPDYRELNYNLRKTNTMAKVVRAGQVFKANDTELKILWPPEEWESNQANDSSMVILVTLRGRRFLLLGDLSAKKQDILAENLELPDIDVVKVAHHGSKTGVSDKLMIETKPEIAVISVGPNRYGHPSPEILKRLGGLKIMRTDVLGNITCTVSSKELFCEG